MKLKIKIKIKKKTKKNSEVTEYFHNFGTLEQVHCGHWLKRTSVPCNKRLALRWLGVLKTRSKFSPSSLYTALQLEQIVLKAREVMVLIMFTSGCSTFSRACSKSRRYELLFCIDYKITTTDTKKPHTSLKQHSHLLIVEAKRRLYATENWGLSGK